MSDAAKQGPGAHPPGIAYWEYLRIDDLLALQGGVERDESKITSHEVLFIVVHQVYELWFKLVLHELTFVQSVLRENPVPDQRMSLAVQAIRRVNAVMDVASQHWKVMETLSTRDFLDFRDKLLPASGFQSGQFREVEGLLGLDDADRINFGGRGSHERALLNDDGTKSGSAHRLDARRASGPPVRICVDEWLHRTPIRGSAPGAAGDADVVRGFVEEYLAAMAHEVGDPELRASRQADDPKERAQIAERYRTELRSARAFFFAEDVPEAERPRRMRIRAAITFIESYRELPLLAWPRDFLDALVAMEQSILIFRQRHARMVEREIGSRTGTGGSAGVAYLDATALRYRVFKDLWMVRTVLLRQGAIPPLADPGFYEFRHHS